MNKDSVTLSASLTDEQKDALKKYYKQVALLPKWTQLRRNGGVASPELEAIVEAIQCLPKAPKGARWVYSLSAPRQMKQPSVPQAPKGVYVQKQALPKVLPSFEPAVVRENDLVLNVFDMDTLFKVAKRMRINENEQVQVNVSLVRGKNKVGDYNLGVIGFDGQNYLISANTVGIVDMAKQTGLIPSVDVDLISTADAFAYLAKCESKLQQYQQLQKENAQRFDKMLKDFIEQRESKKLAEALGYHFDSVDKFADWGANDLAEALQFYNKVADIYELSDLDYENILFGIRYNLKIITKSAFKAEGKYKEFVDEIGKTTHPDTIADTQHTDDENKKNKSSKQKKLYDFFRNEQIENDELYSDEDSTSYYVDSEGWGYDHAVDSYIDAEPERESTPTDVDRRRNSIPTTTGGQPRQRDYYGDYQRAPIGPQRLPSQATPQGPQGTSTQPATQSPVAPQAPQGVPSTTAQIKKQAEKEVDAISVYIGNLNISDVVGNFNIVIGNNNKIQQNDNTITKN